ncbi:hypothetical protein B296_00019159 [Ensete ventricosum]|uniref:Uncharacterized protein n=1 Tax=Ensete ventricosum TaxID=4639 RepID=A0A427APR3_ENSVE|nr:hypothetical protein B296_00019159 [Ensete ventricosum]
MVLAARAASSGAPRVAPRPSQRRASYDPRVFLTPAPQWSYGFGLTLTRKLNSNSFASWSKDETKRGFKRLYHILASPGAWSGRLDTSMLQICRTGPFGLERWRYASLGRSSHYRLPMRVSGSSRGSVYLKFPGQKGIPQEAFSLLFFGSVELLLDFV